MMSDEGWKLSDENWVMKKNKPNEALIMHCSFLKNKCRFIICWYYLIIIIVNNNNFYS